MTRVPASGVAQIQTLLDALQTVFQPIDSARLTRKIAKDMSH